MLIGCQDTVGASGGDPTLAAWLGQLQDAPFGQAGPAACKVYPPTRLVSHGRFDQTSGSNMNSRTSCAQRQAAAIFAAHWRAASRVGTSTTVTPPHNSLVCG